MLKTVFVSDLATETEHVASTLRGAGFDARTLGAVHGSLGVLSDGLPTEVKVPDAESRPKWVLTVARIWAGTWLLQIVIGVIVTVILMVLRLRR